MLEHRPALKTTLYGAGTFLLVFTAAMAGSAVMIAGGVGGSGQHPDWTVPAASNVHLLSTPPDAAETFVQPARYAASDDAETMSDAAPADLDGGAQAPADVAQSPTQDVLQKDDDGYDVQRTSAEIKSAPSSDADAPLPAN